MATYKFTKYGIGQIGHQNISIGHEIHNPASLDQTM